MYNVLNTLSKYTYFYLSKNFTSYIFLLVFQIVESLQCILKIGITWLCLAITANFHNRSLDIATSTEPIVDPFSEEKIPSASTFLVGTAQSILKTSHIVGKYMVSAECANLSAPRTFMSYVTYVSTYLMYLRALLAHMPYVPTWLCAFPSYAPSLFYVPYATLFFTCFTFLHFFYKSYVPLFSYVPYVPSFFTYLTCFHCLSFSFDNCKTIF